MTVVLLHNPRSGRGRARHVAARFEHALRGNGHAAKSLTVGGDEALDPARLATASALVIIGGDGTVSHAALTAMTAAVPIYHAGTGNENLFARTFGMTTDPRDLLAALAQRNTAKIDTGRFACGSTQPRPFLLMASVGPDASVIRRLANTRTKANGHLAYVGPVMREFIAPYLPRLTIEVDGKPLVSNTRGLAVVGNIRHYAVGLNPTPHACPHDGLLDVTFYPCATSARASAWALSAWARRAHRADASRTSRGRTVTISTPGQPPIAQIDGEWTSNGSTPRSNKQVELGIEPATLRVLLPANG